LAEKDAGHVYGNRCPRGQPEVDGCVAIPRGNNKPWHNRDSGDSREVEEVPEKHQTGALDDAADTEIGRLFHRGLTSGVHANHNWRSVMTLCRPALPP